MRDRAGGRRVGVGGETRFIAAEDAARYRDALGLLRAARAAAGVHRAGAASARVAGRPLRPHPRPVRRRRRRRAASASPGDRASPARSAALEADERLVRGEFRPDGASREWCDVDVLRQLRRRSLAALRREVEPVEPDAYARFLAQWHGIPGERRGLEAVVEALGQLQGAALVASSLETDVLPARVRGYRPADLDELCTAGELVWIGAGARRRQRRSGAVVLRRPAAAAGAVDGSRSSRRPVRCTTRSARCSPQRGASFWTAAARRRPERHRRRVARRAVGPRVGRRGHQRLARAAARRASVAHGTGAPQAGGADARPAAARAAHAHRPAGRRRSVEPGGAAAAAGAAAHRGRARRRRCRLLERYGVVTREAVLAEGVRRRVRRRVRRAEGARGARPDPARLLRRRPRCRPVRAARRGRPAAVGCAKRPIPSCTPTTSRPPVVLAATDPAQPYGAALPWPASPGRPARSARRARGGVAGAAAGVVRPSLAPPGHVPRHARHLG